MEEKLKKEIETMPLSVLKEIQFFINNIIDKKEKKRKDDYLKWQQSHYDEINQSWVLIHINDDFYDYGHRSSENICTIYNLFSKQTKNIFQCEIQDYAVIKLYNENGQIMDASNIIALYDDFIKHGYNHQESINLLQNINQKKQKIR